MMSLLNVPKGTTIYPSITGEYNFHYPNLDNPIVLTGELEVQLLHWKPQNNKNAFKVINSENPIQYVVIWMST